jgi:hypothetical protein
MARARASLTNPFGTPDGAQADVTEVNERFDDLKGLPGHESLSTAHHDLSARILVGRMGAGKTIYQRRLLQRAAEEGVFVLADEIHGRLPATGDVANLANWFSNLHSMSELWTVLWRRAIMRSVVSQILLVPELRDAAPDEALHELATNFDDLVGKPRAPRSPQAELGNMLLPLHGHNAVRNFAYSEGWSDLEYHIASALKEASTVRIHIDGVDEHFETAPVYWMAVQCGLVLCILDLRREQWLGKRLHVVACVRDIVYAELLESEHAPRFSNAPYVRRLDWDEAAIRHLLNHKLRRLGNDYMMDPRRRDAEGWLGVGTIPDAVNGTEEPVERYIIRHTRMLPRDIVDVGNHLCDDVRAAKEEGHDALAIEVLQQTVADRATAFAEAQLRACSNRLAADATPPANRAAATVDVFTGDPDYVQGLKVTLAGLVAGFGNERFDGRRLERVASRADEELRPHLVDFQGSVGAHVLNLLWQHRLLGYVERGPGGERDRFYEGTVGDARLSRDRPEYVLHPCVRYAVPLGRGRFSR